MNNSDENNTQSFNVHVVEDEKGTNKRNEGKQNSSKNSKKRKFDSKDKDSKKKKGPCYNCGKMGHIKKECRLLKKQKQDGNSNFMAMISEVFVVENENEWWIDSGATRHVCKN